MTDKTDDKAPYFTIILVAGWVNRPGELASGMVL
jgi:precorrin-2/cobalt-factor-2 C20-methyltransferase